MTETATAQCPACETRVRPNDHGRTPWHKAGERPPGHIAIGRVCAGRGAPVATGERPS